MYCTHRLVRLLAPLALIGSIAAATPLAQAASQSSTPQTHLRAYGGVVAFRGSAQHRALGICVIAPPGNCKPPKPTLRTQRSPRP
jgi:hypothetical protein